MIFSKTATKEDLKTLKVQELMDAYVSNPKDYINWKGALYRFWDYALVFELLKNNYNVSLANFTVVNDDVVFRNLCESKGINFSNFKIEDIFDLPIRANKYDVITLLGTLENTKLATQQYIHKLWRHVAMDGYIIITTDEQRIPKYKTKHFTPDDLLDISLVLEQFGFEFVSNNKNILVDYDYSLKNYPNSLIMQRVGQ